ncbi:MULTISPECIES: gamma-glutamyltransferase [unclassified Mesorhizobium]|uniref:gamma-glutamyltransferase n=1 Tax=unclassified Mesorhizobium TaxID=325217 RepID=UPI000406F5D1|nr:MULTISPECIES: gamma-glutamyltransferase [unclassified Mesorhizobium]WJI44790.1 gamma-glutamyltransferase family protein [Mesorhizobium sp. C120A]
MLSIHQTTRGGVVATGAPAATEAGAEMLRQGGTAADAAVAAALAMCVADPANASLLGRCQIVLRTREGRFAAIDGASTIPSCLPETLGAGPLAFAAIPCLPQALEKLHAEHGRLSLSVVAAPAARLAEEGFIAPHHLAAAWAQNAAALAKGGAGPYLDDARPPARFRHGHLSALLRAFGECGAAAITSGETARNLAEGVRARGGYWRADDLAANAALDGEILHASFRDCQVTTIGRQGWGHTLIEMLSILDRLPPFADNLTGAEACRLIAVIETCFADRPQRLGSLEPKLAGHAFETLIAPDFIAARAAEITACLLDNSRTVAQSVAPTIRATEQKDTTHLSTLDAQGATVALTMSIGPHFGLRATDAAFGLLPAKSYRMSSDPAPGARDVTEMSPAIVTRGDRVILSVGAAGSELIPGAIVQAIINVVDRGVSLGEALRMPRVNMSESGVCAHDEVGPEAIASLRMRWPGLGVSAVGGDHLGVVQAVGHNADGHSYGSADNAWDGTCVVVPAQAEVVDPAL